MPGGDHAGRLPPGEVFAACYRSTLVTAFAATLARTADASPALGPAAAPSAAPIRASEAAS